MSDRKNSNDEMLFQSFYKNHIFESNKDQNKITYNEIIEFSFKKNLFFPKLDDLNSYNTNNYIIPFNESGIYSKNDANIQVSGHFGKNKYESKNFKSILDKSEIIKHPIFYIEEEFKRTKEEVSKSKNQNILQNNNSNSSPFHNRIKKNEIIIKKKIIKNNSTNYKHINANKTKKESFYSFKNRNKDLDQFYLYKRKIANNINKFNTTNKSNYNNAEKNTLIKRINNTININETELKHNHKIYNYYNKNNNQYKKLKVNAERNNITCKDNRMTNKISSLNIKNLKENKENISNNIYKNHTFRHNENIRYILINNNSYCPNSSDIKYANFDPDKSYQKIYKNKTPNKKDKNGIDRIKNEFKTRNINRNILLGPYTKSLGMLTKTKINKDGIGNEMKNTNIIMNNSNYGNSKHNTINNKSGGLLKKRILKIKREKMFN